MRDEKKKFFTRHAKSSALTVSLVVHAVVLVAALFFVAVSTIVKEDATFEGKDVKRPKMQLRKLRVPVQESKKTPAPKLRKNIVAKTKRMDVEVKLPEIIGVLGGSGYGEGTGLGSDLGFSIPDIDFFGTKAKAGKVVFIVHFGPATIGNNPYLRMTGYTIRKRLEELINELPPLTLFNVAAYWEWDTVVFSPTMAQASEENKKKLKEWMAPVNPLEGEYDHCFIWGGAAGRIKNARNNYPMIVNKGLPFYSPKWVYPYEVPDTINQKYLGGDKNFRHWNRAVTWALETQKPETIFVLTTNYIDPWGGGGNGEPKQMEEVYERMIKDIYGVDPANWPTLNIVVLKHENSDPNRILKESFGPIIDAFRGQGSTITDISNYMNPDEQKTYKKYRAQYD